MKFCESWLRSLVDLEGIGRAQLVDRLTDLGLEVEAVVPVVGAFRGVISARIEAVVPHPAAEQLRLCRVDTGMERLEVVCGAANARVGLVAPLARVGAELPDGRRIEHQRLRGVDSHGMLCSGAELGLEGAEEGLLELDPELPPGTDLAALWAGEASIEIKATPNRGDCLSLLGLARELAAAFGRPLRYADGDPASGSLSAERQVRLVDPGACPRYFGAILRELDTARPTPWLIRERLRRSGVRAVSIVVDIANYVMLELGQPLHAFDLDTLVGDLEVRRARPGERLQLLDGRVAELCAETLVIADTTGPVALAGVMGGEHSKVVAGRTRHLLLESAHFAPAAIMGRARALGLTSDAAYRFERGVDPELPPRALARATALLLQHCGGVQHGWIAAEAPANLPPRVQIALDHARLRAILGLDLDDARIEQHLQALGFRSAVPGTVEAPSWRFDIEGLEDLAEEVARIEGYQAIPSATPRLPMCPGAPDAARAAMRRLRIGLAARGYQEAITLAFQGPELLARWGMADTALALANPLSADLALMRPSLLPGLVEALRHNLNRQQHRVRLFELGAVFLDQGRREEQRLAVVAVGRVRPEQWSDADRAVDLFDLKGDLGALLGTECGRWVTDTATAWLHPGRRLALHRGEQRLGVLGELHPSLCAALDLRCAPQVLELSLAPLLREPTYRGEDLPRYPSVRRDLAIVVPQAVPYEAVAAVLAETCGSTLRSQVLFDVYFGPGVEDACKSLAIGLILQEDSRTLADHEVDQIIAACIAELERRLGAHIRR